MFQEATLFAEEGWHEAGDVPYNSMLMTSVSSSRGWRGRGEDGGMLFSGVLLG